MASSKNWQSRRDGHLSRKGDTPVALFAILACLTTSLLSATPDNTTALLEAIHQDQVEKAKTLLEQGTDPTVANRYGVLPLTLACQNSNETIVQALLKAGADANAEGKGGHTPLMVASRTGRPATVNALLEAGAKVTVTDRKGQTALMWAAVEGHSDVVKALLAAGATDDSPLGSGFNAWFFAARQGHIGVIEALLAHGADVNAPMVNSGGGGRTPRKGTSALILAIENGHFDLATRLLDAGADPNDLRSGTAPLHVLSWVRKPVRGDGIDGAPPPHGSGEMTSLQFVDSLINRGADVNLQLKWGSSGSNRLGRPGATPFLMAARTADLPFMKLLVKHGADFRQPNKQGRTPLLAAAGVALGPEADEAATEAEAMLAVNYLLELGADIDHVDKEGDTIMHAAAYKQAPTLVALLAEKGADINIWNRKNKKGWTPLLISQGFRHGNFKPSDQTIAAISKVMLAEGVTPTPSPPPPGTDKREKYQN